MAGNLGTLGSVLAGFFRWWFAELAGLAPPGLGRLSRRGDKVLWLDLIGEKVAVRYATGKTSRDLGETSAGAPDGDPRSNPVATIVRGVNLKKVRVGLRLPLNLALRKTLTMPQAAEPEMRQALALQIDRQSPFVPDEVYYDYRVTERRPRSRELDVELVVMPKSVVDPAIDRVRAWGLRPTIVDIVDDGRPALAPRLNLIAEAEHGKGGGSWFNVFLACLAATLIAVAVYVPFERERAEAAALAREVAVAKDEAEATVKLREELDRLHSVERFLATRKARSPSVLQVLSELTRLLPDDGWLYELRVDGGDIKVSGNARSASALISAIDGSPLFATPSFRAPVTQQPSSGLEKFSLSFTVEGGE